MTVVAISPEHTLFSCTYLHSLKVNTVAKEWLPSAHVISNEYAGTLSTDANGLLSTANLYETLYIF